MWLTSWSTLRCVVLWWILSDCPCAAPRTRPSPCGSSSGPSSTKTSPRRGWSSSTFTTTTSWSTWWTMTFLWRTACGRWSMTCSSFWTLLRRRSVSWRRLNEAPRFEQDFLRRIKQHYGVDILCIIKESCCYQSQKCISQYFLKTFSKRFFVFLSTWAHGEWDGKWTEAVLAEQDYQCPLQLSQLVNSTHTQFLTDRAHWNTHDGLNEWCFNFFKAFLRKSFIFVEREYIRTYSWIRFLIVYWWYVLLWVKRMWAACRYKFLISRRCR